MVNVALIGAGTMGRVHAESCAALPGVRLAWVADRDAGRAAQVADAHGARAAADPAEACVDPAVAAVLVTAPTPFHRAMVELAAAHGKHIFCEKPIAPNHADAAAMVAACRQAGVRLMVGHVVRFFPEYARIKELLDGGAIGRPGVVRARRVNVFPRGWDNWYADLARSGGPIVDLMIHDLDTLRWYFGEPLRVYARGLSGPAHNEFDLALAVIRFANGVIAHCEGTWTHPDGFRTGIEIAGDGGLLAHASTASQPLRWERPPVEVAAPAGFVPRSVSNESPYRTELRHFFDRLADGAPFMVDGEEAVRSLDLALAILESVQTGRVVTIGGRG
ncbi:MAG TPA: Gfo/Idh/MocA family oxidoreductase [Thermomicrobiales bacterium]|nr:Gfo/Idh/MocA family oxidoreductase [Thermomicrobiales bacterium]